MDDNQIKRQIYTLLAVASIFTISLVIFYFCHISTHPITGPKGLQGFAVFFGGMAAPIMTMIAVIPLVMTLILQQRQFQTQQQNFQDEQNKQRLLTYISRFEQKKSQYEEFARQPVGFRRDPDAVILKGVEYLEPGSDLSERTGEFINEIPTLMKAHTDGPDGLPPDKIRDAMFLFELANHAGSACRVLSYSFRFATLDDYQLLDDSKKAMEVIINELLGWEIINLEESIALIKLIKIPQHLTPEQFRSQG